MMNNSDSQQTRKDIEQHEKKRLQMIGATQQEHKGI